MEFIQQVFDFITYLVNTIKRLISGVSGKDDEGLTFEYDENGKIDFGSIKF